MPFSLHTVNRIGNEGLTALSEALKSNSSLTSLNLSGDNLFPHSFSLSTANGNIDKAGAIKLYEALISNSSLIELNLRRNTLVVSQYSHSTL
jgi:hypothetical protein